MLSDRSWKPKSPRDLLLSLQEEFPDIPRERLFEKFQAALKSHPDLQRPVDWYFFSGMIGAVTVKKRPPTLLDVSRDRQELTRRLHNRVLMDVLLPNGRKLAESTFRACAEAGGWFSKIAGLGEPDQVVGEVLTENELPDLESA